MEYLCHLWHERPSKRVPGTCSRSLTQSASLSLSFSFFLHFSLSLSLCCLSLWRLLQHFCIFAARSERNEMHRKISWPDKAKPKIKRSQIGKLSLLLLLLLVLLLLLLLLLPSRRRKANRKRKISVGRYEHMDKWTFGSSSSSSRCLWVAAGGGPFAYWNDWTRSRLVLGPQADNCVYDIAPKHETRRRIVSTAQKVRSV